MSTSLHSSNELRGAAATSQAVPSPPQQQSARRLQHNFVEEHTRHSSTPAAQEAGLNHRTFASSLVDIDGLRCEVRSMRSVPHALYTLPSVAHVVAAYVRQLVDDFSSSLLLCRPASRATTVTVSGESGNLSGTFASEEDEETYLLLRLCAQEARQRRLRRRAQLRRERRAGGEEQQQQDPQIDSDKAERAEEEDDATSDDAEDAAEGNGCASDWLWDSFAKRSTDTKNNNNNNNNNSGETTRNKYFEDCAVKRRASKNLRQVENQLVRMFAAVDEARRGGSASSPSHTSAFPPNAVPSFASASDGAVVFTPPLLSALLRFKPLLRDMQFLARHLLLPRHAWPHHQREWVCVYEDVSVTLRDRLARHRRRCWLHQQSERQTAGRNAVANDDDDGLVKATNNNSSDSDNSSSSSVDNNTGDVQNKQRPQAMPAREVELLWHTLYEVLGAAWRQRDRLWGAYRYLQGPRQLPPLSLNSQAAQATPPSIHSSPILRDQFTRHLMYTAQLTNTAASNNNNNNNNNNSHGGSSSAGAAGRVPQPSSTLPASLTSAHEEDCCAFGPFTSADLGISSSQLYVFRHPLAAALRRLRVCVPPSGRDALATSTTAFAGFKYVSDPARKSSAPGKGPDASQQQQQQQRSTVVPLFDVTEEDARVRAAVPYLAPEVFLTQRHLQLRQELERSSNRVKKGSSSSGEKIEVRDTVPLYTPVHRFSDDVWNSAVVVMEAALSGFAVVDPTQCHLSRVRASLDGAALNPASPLPSDEQQAKRADASPDAVPPTQTASGGQVMGMGRGVSALHSSPVLSLLLPSESVYADVLLLLMHHHGLSEAAAHNFMYAALHHLRRELQSLTQANCRFDEDESIDGSTEREGEMEEEEERDISSEADQNARCEKREDALTVSPARLAREWLAYLRAQYPRDFVRDVLAGEVAAKGLRWRRSERWNAFGHAHAAAGAAANVNGISGGGGNGPASTVSPTVSAHDYNTRAAAAGSPGPATAGGRGAAAAASSFPSPTAPNHLNGGASMDKRGHPASLNNAASLVMGSVGSMSVLSDDNSHLMSSPATGSGGGTGDKDGSVTFLRATGYSAGPSDEEETGAAGLTAVAAEFKPKNALPLQQQVPLASSGRRVQTALTVSLPSRPNSFASLESFALSPSAMQSPLRAGSFFGSPFSTGSAAATVATPTRLPQKLDRAVNALDTPLMSILRLPSGRRGQFGGVLQQQQGGQDAVQRTGDAMAGRERSVDVWERLARFLRRRTSAAGVGSSSYNNKNGMSSTNNSMHHSISNSGGAFGGGGGSLGKANGAVADAADVDKVEEFLHLLYSCVLVTLRQFEQRPQRGDAKSGTSALFGNKTEATNVRKTRSSEAEDRAKYAAVNHPFLRGVAERGLLSTYMTVCGCTGDDTYGASISRGEGELQSQRATAAGLSMASAQASALPSLNLYIPARVLLATLTELEKEDGFTANGAKLDVHAVTDTLAAAATLTASVDQLLKQSGALRTLIGDDVRAWEAARDAARRTRASYPSYYNYYNYNNANNNNNNNKSSLTNTTSLHGQPSAANEQSACRAQAAVDAVLSSLELTVPLQLRHITELRRLIYENFTPDGVTAATSSGGGFGGGGNSNGFYSCSNGSPAAVEVRRYLRTHTVPLLDRDEGERQSQRGQSAAKKAADVEQTSKANRSGCSPFFPIPPTLRGVVWGCLLNVPSARKREAVLAHAVHRTAAKPSLNDRQLSVDIPRCHAYHPLLAAAKGSAQLQRLLKAWLFLHPRYAYWQGLDSVCAVLLTVSSHDEALVLAQLSAVVDRYIAHDEGGEETGFGSRSSLLAPSPSPHLLHPQPQQQQKPSMADQLHRLAVVLRYCDPLLAHYLFDVLSCTPELYAISWLLTLFSHSLPTRKVYLLWDLLFVLSDSMSSSNINNTNAASAVFSGSACLVALCAAVMMQRRAALLSADFTGCLAVFSSNGAQMDVAAAVGDTRQLLSVLPPSVLMQPCGEDAGVLFSPAGGSFGASGGISSGAGRHSPNAARSNGVGFAGAGMPGSITNTFAVAYISVDDVKAAWAAAQSRGGPLHGSPGVNEEAYGVWSTRPRPPQQRQEREAKVRDEEQQEPEQQLQQHWSDSGVYLVDVRCDNPREGPQDAVLGAIHLPLLRYTSGPQTPPPLFSAASSQRTSEVANRSDGTGQRPVLSPTHSNNTNGSFTPAAGEGWGIVDDQERLQAQQQLNREAQERHVADAAAELVRHLGNPSVAAIVPRLASPPPPASTSTSSSAHAMHHDANATSLPAPAWAVHPIVLKTSMAPHVILLTSGRVSGGPASALRGAGTLMQEAEEEMRLAHLLGLQLSACGVHNVSILRGGVAAVRWAMPELVVPQSQSS